MRSRRSAISKKVRKANCRKFMNNESDLHSVMIALEKADLSFQVMMQVRNKIVAGVSGNHEDRRSSAELVQWQYRPQFKM